MLFLLLYHYFFHLWSMVQTLRHGPTVGSPQNSSAPPSLGSGRVAPPRSRRVAALVVTVTDYSTSDLQLLLQLKPEHLLKTSLTIELFSFHQPNTSLYRIVNLASFWTWQPFCIESNEKKILRSTEANIENSCNSDLHYLV